MQSKNILRSKTFWVQAIAVASTFCPPVRAWLVANPESAVGALAAANLLVRFATQGRITLFGAGETGATLSGGAVPLGTWMVTGATAAALMGALPSCATTTGPDGSRTSKPDVESIEVGFSIAQWAAATYQIMFPPKAAEVITPGK